MTYLYVNLAVMGAAIVAAGLVLSRVGPHHRGRTLLVSLIACAVVALLTAVFDTIMIAVGLFTYAEEHLIGWRVGLAPIEDFSYVFVVALLLPALWAFLRRGRGEDEASTVKSAAGRAAEDGAATGGTTTADGGPR